MFVERKNKIYENQFSCRNVCVCISTNQLHNILRHCTNNIFSSSAGHYTSISKLQFRFRINKNGNNSTNYGRNGKPSTKDKKHTFQV